MRTMRQNLSQRMLEFAAKEVGPRTAPELTLTTQVERDLGITGDDAEIFIQKFAATFSVDMTGFQFNKYFGRRRIPSGDSDRGAPSVAATETVQQSCTHYHRRPRFGR